MDINLTKKQWLEIENLSRFGVVERVLKINNRSASQETIRAISEKKNALYVHLIEDGLNKNSVGRTVLETIDEIKKRGFLVVCSSDSNNAIKQLQQIGIYKKFDFIVDYNNIQKNILLNREETKGLLNPVSIILEHLGLRGSECIGFEHSKKGIERYKQFGIFSVSVGQGPKTNADYNIDFLDIENLESVLFSYFRKHEKEQDIIG